MCLYYQCLESWTCVSVSWGLYQAHITKSSINSSSSSPLEAHFWPLLLVLYHLYCKLCTCQSSSQSVRTVSSVSESLDEGNYSEGCPMCNSFGRREALRTWNKPAIWHQAPSEPPITFSPSPESVNSANWRYNSIEETERERKKIETASRDQELQSSHSRPPQPVFVSHSIYPPYFPATYHRLLQYYRTTQNSYRMQFHYNG